MNYSTLVLNGDSQVLSIIPLSVVSWQEAIKLVYLEKATVTEIYENSRISSQKLSMSVPSVIILNKYYKNKYVPEYTRHNMLYRDEFSCQYCGNEFHPHHLTIDHVIPSSKGGASTWNNTVMACKKCNGTKDNNVWKPLTIPHKPTYYELAHKRKKFPLIIGNDNWKEYLQWDENLLKVGSVKQQKFVLKDQSDD